MELRRPGPETADGRAELLVGALGRRRESIVTAESCTGGLLFSTLAGVTGASACAWGAFVAYQNEAKIALLGLTPSDIAEHGTVSAAMTRLLAERARGRSRCDWAVAVTCSAGPTAAAGSEVGDGFVHVCGPERNHQSRAFHEVGDREQVRHRAVSIAIECVCRTIGLTTD